MGSSTTKGRSVTDEGINNIVRVECFSVQFSE